MSDLRTMFKAADNLVHVTKLTSEARRRAMAPGATFREFIAYETLAEKQQLLAMRVHSLHAIATGKAFQ